MRFKDSVFVCSHKEAINVASLDKGTLTIQHLTCEGCSPYRTISNLINTFEGDRKKQRHRVSFAKMEVKHTFGVFTDVMLDKSSGSVMLVDFTNSWVLYADYILFSDIIDKRNSNIPFVICTGDWQTTLRRLT